MTAHLQQQPLTSAPASRPRRSGGALLRRAVLRSLGGLLVVLPAAFAVGWAVTPGVADAEQRLAASGGTPTTGEVPERIAAALLATEDSRSGTHPGIDWRGALRAPLGVVAGSDLGGSTLQQQLARVLYEDGAGVRARGARAGTQRLRPAGVPRARGRTAGARARPAGRRGHAHPGRRRRDRRTNRGIAQPDCSSSAPGVPSTRA